jgi:hypothetical protein
LNWAGTKRKLSKNWVLYAKQPFFGPKHKYNTWAGSLASSKTATMPSVFDPQTKQDQETCLSLLKNALLTQRITHSTGSFNTAFIFGLADHPNA